MLHFATAWHQRVEDWAKLLLSELAQKAMTEDDAEISKDDMFVRRSICRH